MRDSVPSASYSSVCNVLRQWNISLIRSSLLIESTDSMILILLLLIIIIMDGKLGHSCARVMKGKFSESRVKDHIECKELCQ